MKKIIFTMILAQLGISAFASTTNETSREMIPLEKIENKFSAYAETESERIFVLDMGLEMELAELMHDLIESDNDPEVQKKVMQFMSMNKKYFSSSQRARLSQQLLSAKNASDINSMLACDFKSPGAAWALNFFLGFLGIDRFYIGQTGAGVLKLITVGGLGLWWFIDLFAIVPATHNVNYKEAMHIAAFI